VLVGGEKKGGKGGGGKGKKKRKRGLLFLGAFLSFVLGEIVKR